MANEAILNNDIINALIILIATGILAITVRFLLEYVFPKLTGKTKTTLDDEILKSITPLIELAIIVAGIFFSLMKLTIISAYYSEVQKIFDLIIIMIGLWFVDRIINVIIRWYLTETSTKTNTQPEKHSIVLLKKIILGFVYVIAGIYVINVIFGVEITPLVAGLGIAGLAVALALQDPLSNFFSGIFIIADRRIKIGDYIQLDNGKEGYVEDIGWRSICIRTLGNNRIIIPNSKLSQSIITNYYNIEEQMNVLVSCGVSYNSDLEKVERITVAVAKEVQQNVPGAVKNFDPFIRYNAFGESNINFDVYLRVEKYVDQYLVVHEFIKRLKERYEKEGIEISFPARNIYFKNGQEK